MNKNRTPNRRIPLERHVGWIDLLCVPACFLVILSHCCDPFVAVFDNDRPVFLQGVMAGSLGRILPALVFWSLLLPYVRMAAPLLGYAGNSGNMGLYGECDWNIYGTFYYVSGFAGYIVLAFYLVKFPLEWSWRRLLAVCIPSFAVGYLITLIGFVEMQRHFPGDYACLETIWYFAGIDVFLMTVPVFLIVQKATVRPRLWLARLAGVRYFAAYTPAG